jgi:PmbA protein
MMIDTIIAALEAASAKPAPGAGATISDWRLVETKKTGWQRFYIGKALDQRRALDLVEYRLTLYVDSERDGVAYRGEATVAIHPTQTPEEIGILVARTTFAASKSRTPHFGIPGPAPARVDFPVSAFEGRDIELCMDDLARALYAPDGPPESDARINSLELFLTRQRTRIANSRGCDVSFAQWKGECEFIVEASGPAGDVELYDDIVFGEPDLARLGSATASLLLLVAERARARAMPALVDTPLILRGENAQEVFAWFHDNARSDMVYTKASPFSAGSPVQGEASVAEALDTRAESFIPGLPQSAPFDPEGYPISSSPIIESGVITTLHGPVRYAQRLGLPATGAFPLFSVSPGALALDALREKPCLEPLLFSDFQLDSQSGSFGAEIRLAWYFDGKERYPVTGGSVTGSLMDNRAAMLRSRELSLCSRSLCPSAVKLFSVSVTGAS